MTMAHFGLVVFVLIAILSGWQVALGDSTQVRRAYAPFLGISVLMIVLYIASIVGGLK